MKGRNVLIYSSVTIRILALIGYALWQEIARNESQIQTSISGTIKTAPSVTGGVVKTDNAYLILFRSRDADSGCSTHDQPISPTDYIFNWTS